MGPNSGRNHSPQHLDRRSRERWNLWIILAPVGTDSYRREFLGKRRCAPDVTGFVQRGVRGDAAPRTWHCRARIRNGSPLPDAADRNVIAWPYRGLKLKTTGTDWDVEAFSCTANELPGKLTGPVIISVGLIETEGVDPRYREKRGWIPGIRHSVVLFQFKEDGSVEIGDPAIGREHWSVRSIRDLYRGQGMRLVHR